MKKFLGLRVPKFFNKPDPIRTPVPIPKAKDRIIVPGGSDDQSSIKSIPDLQGSDILTRLSDINLIEPLFPVTTIPLIRKLFWANQNVSLAVTDFTQLANTGHIIKFDKSVPADQVDAMRRHLIRKSEQWGFYTGGVEGIVNKLLIQVYIAGSFSFEVGLSDNIEDGISKVVMVNPESIRFRYLPTKKSFIPYQITHDPKSGEEKLIKLNLETYRYISLFTDQEIPYGIPPILAALEDLGTQRSMLQNINYVVELLGVLGFTSVNLRKPEKTQGETDPQYSSRLRKLLNDTKERGIKGLKQGLLVGFIGDHEYEFHSTSNNIQGIDEIFSLNQRLLANGMKFPTSFMSVGGSTETMLNVVFTKLISQLRNIQAVLIKILEFIYNTELRLSGFKYDYLSVEFNPSTVADDLKIQQAREIKFRTLQLMYIQGLISQETLADLMGFEAPASPEPLVPVEMLAGGSLPAEEGEKKEKRKDTEGTNERRKRDKDKSQPKRGDQDSRKR